METKKENLQDGVVRKIVATLRHYWGLMLLIVLIAALIGVVYANLKKPTYTAQCTTIYKAEQDNMNSYSNVALTRSYFPTFIDFCNEMCVIERANFYYHEFKNGTETDVDKYIAQVKANVKADADTYDSATGNINKNTDISTSSLRVYAKDSQNDDFTMFVNYTDYKTKDAIEKAKITVMSIELEANVRVQGTNQSKYFGDATIHLNEHAVASYGATNKTKIVIIAVLAGLVLACIIVYLISVLNRSVRSSEELEKITGVSVLAYIAYQGD